MTVEDIRSHLAFEAIGLASRARLRTLGWRPNDRMDPGFRAVTTVIRVPVPVGERVEAALERVRVRWPAHVFYPASSIHVTVLNLDHTSRSPGPSPPSRRPKRHSAGTGGSASRFVG